MHGCCSHHTIYSFQEVDETREYTVSYQPCFITAEVKAFDLCGNSFLFVHATILLYKGLGLVYRVRAQRSLSRCLERRGFNLTVWWSRMPESSWNCTGLYLRWVGYCLDIITESNAACVAPQRPSHDHFWIHSFMLPGSPTAISRSSHAFSHCMQGKILRQCLFL